MRGSRRTRFLARVLLLAAVCPLAGCAAGLYDVERDYTERVEPPAQAGLATWAAGWRQRTGAESGFLPLVQGPAALGTRLQLIDLAESTIDAQYFILKPDTSGYLFASALTAAADRGVRVRFLIDDLSTPVDDASLLLLDGHDNIEVRLFNPVGRGGLSYWGNFVRYYQRANRRMHNKTFFVDGRVGIIGGRNIGNEYFGLKGKDEFLDLDLLVVGDAAGPTAGTFDTFWNHPLAVPVSAYAERVSEKKQAIARSRAQEASAEATATYRDRVVAAGVFDDVQQGRRELYTGTARAITDAPDKLLVKPSGEHFVVINEITTAMDRARREVIIVTPYLIPGDGGVDLLSALVARGIRVAILTNSLASNNHVAVHGAYERYRRKLLEAGVEIYEVRTTATSDYFELGSIESDEVDGLALHTKAVVVDREFVYAGSLNMDPRAVELNTEFGLLIDSPGLANSLAAMFDERAGGPATYTVELVDGDLQWRTRVDGEERVVSSEPDAGFWRRLMSEVSKLLPEKQL